MNLRRMRYIIGAALFMLSLVVSLETTVRPAAAAGTLSDGDKSVCSTLSAFTLKYDFDNAYDSIYDQDHQDAYGAIDEQNNTYYINTDAIATVKRCTDAGFCKDTGEGVGGEVTIECTDDTSMPGNPSGGFPAPPSPVPAGMKPLLALMCDVSTYSTQEKKDCKGEVAHIYTDLCTLDKQNPDKLDEWADCTYKQLVLAWLKDGPAAGEFGSAYPDAKPVPPVAQIKQALKQGIDDAEAVLSEAAKQDCTKSGGIWKDGTCATPDSSSCAIDGVGWIICPVMNFMAKVVDETYKVVAQLLTVQPLTTDTSKSSLYSIWSIMRNLANVCFIVAFLLIIYSQITNVGISNYGIKKMLPKIFIAAVLVNTSYWLCAIGVDLSNIIGTSTKHLFDGLGSQIKTPDFSVYSTGGSGWQGIVGPILAGTLIGVSVYLGIGSILIALPAALLAIFTVFIVLTIRQALIIVLIAVSPLAFVAYLLPNTGEWFKKWRGLFQTMLLMFPIIAAIFGGSALASKVIMTSAVDENGDGIFAVQIMGALVAIVPLAITPVIMKTAGGVLNRIAGIVNNPNRGPVDALRKRAQASAERISSNRDRRALNSRSPLRNIPLPFMSRRRDLIGQMKREARKQQRDATYETVANSDRGVSPFTRRPNGAADYRAMAVDAQETAGKTKQILENEVKRAHLENNEGLHTRAIVTGLDLKNLEETHKNETEGQHMQANPNQYDALNESRGEKKAAELETQRRFEDSAVGRVQSEMHQGLEEQLDTIKKQQTGAYKGSAVGQVNSQANREAGAAVQITDSGNELRYKQSDAGREQAQDLKTVQGEVSLEDDETERVFKISDAGTDQAQRKKTVQTEIGMADTAAGIAYEESAVGQAQSQRAQALEGDAEIAKKDNKAAFAESEVSTQQAVNNAVTDERIAAAKAGDDALVQELKTEEGATRPENAAYVQGGQAAALNETDTRKRVQTQRASSASHIGNVGYQKAVKASEGVAGGLAEQAGGIDKSGATRAVAAATQAIDRELSDNIAMQKTTLESMRVPELFAVMKDETAPAEKRAAAAGLLMKNGGDQHVEEVIDYLGTVEAPPDVDENGVESPNFDVAVIQKQVAADIGPRKPKGTGRSDITAMAEGNYGRNGFDVATNPDGSIALDSSGQPVKTRRSTKSFNDSLVSRINRGKFSAQTIAEAGEDELTRIAEVVHTRGVGRGPGQILPEQYDTFVENIRNARENTTLSGSVSGKEISGILDRIIERESARDILELNNPNFTRTSAANQQQYSERTYGNEFNDQAQRADKKAQDEAFKTYDDAGNVQE